MKRRNFVATISAGAAVPFTNMNACRWDRDTLDMEAKQAPGFIPVITGRFPRNPANYYHMRLARVEKEIEKTPENLNLYDDAGVSSDATEQGSKAIEWMNRKWKFLEANKNLPDYNTHKYRYLANLGTFQIHEWLHAGASAINQDLALAARENIGKAILLNPNAHFGRERFQFMAIDWIIRTLDYETKSSSFLEESEHYIKTFGKSDSARKNASKGISGLIYLGNAWESVDIFRNLAKSLNGHHSSIAHLAYLRMDEIKANGGKSFWSADKEERRSFLFEDDTLLEKNAQFFKAARKEADEWLAARNAFMEARFVKGVHPDTHPKFWEGAKYDGKPPTFNGKVVG